MPRPSTRILLVALILATTLPWIASCGGGSKKHQAVPIPPVSNLREAANTMLGLAEQIEGPPSWINHERENDGYLFGIGSAPAQRDRAQDLFSAMQDSRAVILTWLVERGPAQDGPLGLVPPLRQDPNHIQFEQFAFDQIGKRWYSLAHLSKTEEAAMAKTEIEGLNAELTTTKLALIDSQTEDGDRIRAALRTLYDVDRRAQWNARYDYFTGNAIPAPTGFDDTELTQQARTILTDHGVRVIIEGADLPGVDTAIEGALGDVYIQASEFGDGLIAINVNESRSESHGMHYLVLDGTIQLAIEGGEARAVSRPLRAVTTLDDVDGARARNAQTLGDDITKIVRETLDGLAG